MFDCQRLSNLAADIPLSTECNDFDNIGISPMKQRASLFMATFLCVYGCLGGISLSGESTNVIVIEEPQLVKKEIGTSLPIVGFRSVSSSFVARKFVEKQGDELEEGVFIPESLIVKAWLKDKKFAEAVNAKDVSEITIEKLKASGIDVSKFEWTPIKNDLASVQGIVLDEKDTFIGAGKVDSSAIIAMTSAGMFDLTNKYETVFEKPTAYAVGFKAEYSRDIFKTYEVAAKFQDFPLSDPTTNWAAASKLIKAASAQYPIDFEKALTVELGNATFGKLRIQSAREAGFEVDSRIAKKNDIYLVEFAVTLYDLPTGSIDELSFRVDCVNVCIAWELAPMRVVVADENTTTVNTPSVTFKDVTVGEFFKKTVTYKTLRPQIIAFGLREDSFSWSLKDAAIGTGSYVFLAALGVPKGTKNFTVQRSIAVKTTDGFVTEGGWASTDKMAESVSLVP